MRDLYRNRHPCRRGVQPFIPGEQRSPRGQPNRRQKVDINIAEAAAEQGFPLNEIQHFAVPRDDCPRQAAQGVQNHLPLAEAPGCQAADDKGMDQDPAIVEHIGQDRIAMPEAIDPDRGIEQNQARSDCPGHRGKSGSLPPRRARRRALSRWINALSASRTKADFSCKPVNRWASFTRSSSKANVVRMPRPLPGTK